MRLRYKLGDKKAYLFESRREIDNGHLRQDDLDFVQLFPLDTIGYGLSLQCRFLRDGRRPLLKLLLLATGEEDAQWTASPYDAIAAW